MNHDSRVYNITTAPEPNPDTDREAARRVVARNVTDAAERAQVEAMLGLAS